MVLRSGVAEWTVKRSKTGKGDYEALDSDKANIAPPDAALSSPELTAGLKSIAGRLKGDLCLGIPSDKALIRIVDLPTIDCDEIASMVELQVDKFSPFPVEQMSVSFEVVAAEESSSRVLIVALQHEVVEAWGQALSTAGLLAHSLDLEVMGWLHLLRKEGRIPEQGFKVLLLLDRTGLELVVTHGGTPVIMRSLGDAQGISESEFHEEIAGELAYTLTALEAERGLMDVGRIELWHWDDAPAELIEKIREETSFEVEPMNFSALPSLSEGIAGRVAERGETTIDLAPADWHLREANRRVVKTLLVSTGVFVAIWIVAVAGFLGLMNMQKGRLVKIKTEVESLEGPAAELQTLTKKIESFEQYADRTHSALECLREVSQLLPQGIDLTRFRYDKGNSVDMDGEASSTDPYYDFLQAMQQSALFTEVRSGNIRSESAGAGRKSKFTVSAKLPGEVKH
jgi:Tfp pilus assembly protein PilN